MHRESYPGRGVGILAAEVANDPLAYQTAVLVIGLRQHDNQLRGAAPGHHIALTKAVDHQCLQIVHGGVQLSPGKRSAVFIMDGQQRNVDHVAAAEDGTSLHLI